MTSDSLPQPTRDEAIALLRKGLDKALQTAAAQHVMPICWIAAEKGNPLILGNGSAFMLDAGAGPFLVTANHVYAEFRAARVARPDTICVLGDMARFPLEQRLIASDPVYDVASFRVTAQEVEGFRHYGKFALTGSQLKWPPNLSTSE